MIKIGFSAVLDLATRLSPDADVDGRRRQRQETRQRAICLQLVFCISLNVF